MRVKSNQNQFISVDGTTRELFAEGEVRTDLPDWLIDALLRENMAELVDEEKETPKVDEVKDPVAVPSSAQPPKPPVVPMQPNRPNPNRR